mgnify:CR=1 FL=1
MVRRGAVALRYDAAMTEFPRFDLRDQVALVTGAARGLGRAIALTLAHAGADVALGLRRRDSAPDLVAQIEALGRRAVPLQMDVSRLDQVRDAVAATVQHFGQLDLLVNNAGLGFAAPLEQVTEEEFDQTLAINLKGTFFASQYAARHMIERRRGCIVHLGSQAGAVALPDESVYCMTKAAIAHLTRCQAVEWGGYNIRVNCVAPTFIATPGTDQWLGNPTFRADVIERIAGLHRIGEPGEVAGAVLFLASPAAALITGHTLLVDGGWTAR